MQLKKIYLTVTVAVLVLAACTPGSGRNRAGEFEVKKSSCVSLREGYSGLTIRGSVWYGEDDILHSGRPGLHWVGNTPSEQGTLLVHPVQMVVSPDGKTAALCGYETEDSALDAHVYFIEDHTLQPTRFRWRMNWPVLTNDKKLMGTTWEYHEFRISVITLNLATGNSRVQYDYFDNAMSSDPLPQVARNGLLVYEWYLNFHGSRLVVYNIRKEQEIARYEGLSYEIKPSWYGFLINAEGTRILSISSPADYGPNQQELFMAEIGKEPVRVTNFRAFYPYFIIYNLRSGGQRWSPDNRWVVITAIPSKSQYINSVTADKYLFLVDLENKVAYPFCKPGTGDVVWAPDSRYFALSMGDKLWIVNPETRESRLLIERPGIPLKVLGWTVP